MPKGFFVVFWGLSEKCKNKNSLKNHKNRQKSIAVSYKLVTKTPVIISLKKYFFYKIKKEKEGENCTAPKILDNKMEGVVFYG